MSRSIDRLRARLASQGIGPERDDVLGAGVGPNTMFDWEVVNPDRVTAFYANGQHSWDTPGDIKVKNSNNVLDIGGGRHEFRAYQIDRGGVLTFDVDYVGQGTPQRVIVYGGEVHMTDLHDYNAAKAAPVRTARALSRNKPSPVATRSGGVVAALRRLFR